MRGRGEKLRVRLRGPELCWGGINFSETHKSQTYAVARVVRSGGARRESDSWIRTRVNRKGEFARIARVLSEA